MEGLKAMTRREWLMNLGLTMSIVSPQKTGAHQESQKRRLPYDFFPISYWWGPPATAERYQELAECNFTMTFEADIDLSHRFGMKCLVLDERIVKAAAQPGPDWEKLVEEAVTDYRNHPALFGYYIKDEPNASEFPNLAKVHRRLLELDPQSVPYINLFPTYASQEQLGTATYEEYVDQFLQMIRPKVLSYDHYAFLEGKDRTDYFLNMELIRLKALQVGIPFWFILLSTPAKYYRTPTEGELRWQVYTSLAYGAKGIMYFTYWTVDYEGWGDGIIRRDGTRSERYEIVKEINREVKVLGPLLLELDSRQV
ncbi:MAG: beta-galactosidase, partial [Armatimonadetes bacterium]|nr:beta-galactosidase [Armatimonadota bacterium]